jgi:pyruvate dehydrogenase E2 component (dihydrolipoamide acetyltransferase)
MTEGNLIRWLKKEGEKITAGHVLAEIETDKATMEIEAVDEGILGKILVSAGTEAVKVNQVIGIILEDGEKEIPAEFLSTSAPTPSAVAVSQTSSATQPALAQNVVALSPGVMGDRIAASPLARRLAHQQGVDLRTIVGSGPNGRIIKADIEKWEANPSAGGASRAPSPTSLSQGASALTTYDDIPLSGMRKTIAKRLSESKQTIPHFYLSIDCELDELLKLRQQINAAPDTKVSVNDLVIRAAAVALMRVPEANASWHETSIRQYHQADIAVAVAIDGGLVTPIVRGANSKTVSEISSEMKILVDKARTGKLKPEEFQGGSFSISNLGMFGITSFSAIINPPHGCILAVGAGEQRPVVKNGQLTVATVMTCTLSVDHRVVDGAIGAKFLSEFKAIITNPITMLI